MEGAACEIPRDNRGQVAVPELYTYAVALVRVVDGDTIVFDIDLGFKTWLRNQSVRLYGVNTAETNSRDAAERESAKIASTFTRTWLTSASKLTLKSNKYDDREKYGRILGTIYRDGDAVSLNEALVTENHAVRYMER